MIDLTAAGLSETETKCYQALIEKPEWKPADLAEYVHETRTNCYKILDNLVAKKLAERFDKAKKLHYRAVNPARLLELAREQREAREQADQQLNVAAQDLIQQYVRTHEQAGVRMFQGEDGLKTMYEEQVATGDPIYIIRSDSNLLEASDMRYMLELRHTARKKGVVRHAITPDRVNAPKNFIESDAFMLIDRTWLPADTYTTPVEWDAYGDKVAILSFGTDITGVIIESPQIAESFRQLHGLLKQGLLAHPDYTNLPKLAKQLGPTSEKDI